MHLDIQESITVSMYTGFMLLPHQAYADRNVTHPVSCEKTYIHKPCKVRPDILLRSFQDDLHITALLVFEDTLNVLLQHWELLDCEVPGAFREGKTCVVCGHNEQGSGFASHMAIMHHTCARGMH